MCIFKKRPVNKPDSLANVMKIINDYGEVLERVSTEDKEKYPAGVYPESLLPYPKVLIQKVLEIASHDTSDKNYAETLKVGLVFLNDFVSDEVASAKNGQMLKAIDMVKQFRENKLKP